MCYTRQSTQRTAVLASESRRCPVAFGRLGALSGWLLGFVWSQEPPLGASGTWFLIMLCMKEKKRKESEKSKDIPEVRETRSWVNDTVTIQKHGSKLSK